MLHHQRGISKGHHVNPADPPVGIIESGMSTRRIGRNFEKFGNSREIELGLRALQEDDSGTLSPPLWKTTSPPMSPKTRALRSQAIAEGRKEMMEMIQGMPESDYELSLKDLVELPSNRAVWQSALVDERYSTSDAIQEERKMKMTPTKKKTDKRRHSRSRNVESGAFLLKMFFPSSLGPKKKSSGTGTCAKVSPKPPSVEGEKVGLEKSVDGECWKKRVPEAEKSDTIRRSRSSGSCCSSNSNGRSRHIPGCWSFFTKRSKAREHKGYCF